MLTEQKTDQPQLQLSVTSRPASFLALLRDPVKFFTSVSNHLADIAEIRLGNRRFYIVKSPALIHDFLVTHASSFEKFPPGNPKQRLFGNGLLTSEEPIHKRQRRSLQPAFRRERLGRYATHMMNAVEQLGAVWRHGQVIDISAAMNRLTLQVISESFFSLADTALIADLGRQLHIMLSLVNRFVLPWGDLLMRLPLPSSIRYQKATKRLDNIVYDLIRSARSGDDSETLTSMLLDSTNLTDKEIRDEIVTMVVAGHETVAVGLSWCLYLLARHPDIQEQLVQQTNSTLGGAAATISDSERLEFLQNAFSESLRLYPPIWILGRRAIQDYSFAGFAAKKGSVFLVCMADLHRRPEFFHSPAEFRPQRWCHPSWPNYAYLPFGAGERRCIGERFAWMEGVFFLASLLRRWRFELIEQQLPSADAKLTLNPRNPIRLRVSQR